MGKRNDDGSWTDPCLERLKFGEPFVVIRGQDLLATQVLDLWCTLAEDHGVPPEKIANMRETITAIEAWHPRKIPD